MSVYSPYAKRSPVLSQNGRVAATAMKTNSLTGSGEASHPRAAAEEATLSSLAILRFGNPGVDADPRLGVSVRLRQGSVGLVGHTFWIGV